MEEIREGSIRKKTTDLRSTHKVERVLVGSRRVEDDKEVRGCRDNIQRGMPVCGSHSEGRWSSFRVLIWIQKILRKVDI